MSRKSKAADFLQELYNITVTGRNIAVTEAMKEYVTEKVSRIERFSNKILDVNVIMDTQKFEHRVEIIIKVNHLQIIASAVTNDMYASVDKAVDKLEAQLRKYKSRLQDHQAKKGESIDILVDVLRIGNDELLEVNEEIEDANNRRLIDGVGKHKIVNQETKSLKTLTYEEAIMKLEFSGDIFLAFRAEEDRKLKIIYRRKDGDFGVMQLEI
jgi:putative sigma-54 modulation protein